MKKFLSKILTFFVILYVLAISIDVFVSKQFHHTTDYRYSVWNDILQGEMKNDILIMGSSRAWVQISPQILDSVLKCSSYNLGMDGSGISRQIPRYNLYREYNNHPKVIIQNVDWSSTLENSYQKKGYLLEQYFPYFYQTKMRKLVLKYEMFDFFDYSLPLIRYVRYSNMWQTYQAIKQLRNPEYSLVKGYKGLTREWNGKELHKMDSLKFLYTKQSLNEFCNYVERCKEDSIQMIFVYTPFYIEGTKLVSNISEFYNLFDSIAKKNNIIILNYLSNEICYDSAYFYNAMHLNKKGAERFSIVLAHDLDSIGILK